MSPGRRRWSLGCLLLLLGGNLAVHVEIHQGSINGTVGQPALLPVSYRFDGAPRFPVSIIWRFSNSADPLLTCTVLNCSVDAGGVPYSCSARCFPHDTYRGRAELFPENGSLLLRDLRLHDSGVYNVAFRPGYQTGQVTLTVHEPRFTPRHPAWQQALALSPVAGAERGGGAAAHIPCYVLGGCYCFILLLLQLLLHLCWRRPNCQEASTTASSSAQRPRVGKAICSMEQLPRRGRATP